MKVVYIILAYLEGLLGIRKGRPPFFKGYCHEDPWWNTPDGQSAILIQQELQETMWQ